MKAKKKDDRWVSLMSSFLRQMTTCHDDQSNAVQNAVSAHVESVQLKTEAT